MLVFLPGAGEIRRVEALLLEAGLPADVRLLPLYGDLSAAAQDAVLAPAATGSRKLVLATNIAETSLTIPGVTAVVDSGLVRRSQFDPVTGMSRLEIMRISRAASEQRAGRAGRVAPGDLLPAVERGRACEPGAGDDTRDSGGRSGAAGAGAGALGRRRCRAAAVARCTARGDAAAGAHAARAARCAECARAHDGAGS